MIDLSHRLETGMPVYPGDPRVRLSDALTIAQDGVAVLGVEFGSHTGTHLDAPSHTVTGGRTLDEISLDELVGDAVIIRVNDARPRQALTGHDLGLDAFARLDPFPEFVVVNTGWDRYFGSEQYLDHPYLTRSAAQRLCELGMRLLGIDTLSPDPTGSGAQLGAVEGAEVHEVVLGADRLIVENLRGLDLVGERARLGFFPLRLAGGDGAPVRAVAFDAGRGSAG